MASTEAAKASTEAAPVQLPPIEQPWHKQTLKEMLGFAIVIEAEEWRNRTLAVLQVFTIITGLLMVSALLDPSDWVSSTVSASSLVSKVIQIMILVVVTSALVVAMWPCLLLNDYRAHRCARIFSLCYQLGLNVWFATLYYDQRLGRERPTNRTEWAMSLTYWVGLSVQSLLAIGVTFGPWSSNESTWTAYVRKAQREYTRKLVNQLLKRPKSVDEELPGLRSAAGKLVCHDGTEHDSVASLVARCASAEGPAHYEEELLRAPPVELTKAYIDKHTAERPPLEARKAPRPQGLAAAHKQLLKLGVRDDYNRAFFYPSFMILNTGLQVLLVLVFNFFIISKAVWLKEMLDEMAYAMEDCAGDQSPLCLPMLQLGDYADNLISQGMLVMLSDEGRAYLGNSSHARLSREISQGFGIMAPSELNLTDAAAAQTFLTGRDGTPLDGAMPQLSVAASMIPMVNMFYQHPAVFSQITGASGSAVDAGIGEATNWAFTLPYQRAQCLDARATWMNSPTAGDCGWKCKELKTANGGSQYMGSCRFFDDLAEALPGAMIVAACFTMLVGLAMVAEMHVGYKRKVLSIRSGLADFAYSPAVFQAHHTVQLLGSVLSCILLGLGLLAVAVFLVTFALWHPKVRELLWGYYDLIIQIAIPLVITMILHTQIFRVCVDFSRSNVTEGTRFSLLSKGLSALFIVKAIFASITRVLTMMGLSILSVMRVDTTMFPKDLAHLDGAYKAFIAAVMLHEPATNPVLSTFLQLVQERDNTSLSNKRARNRWRLALLLHRHPELRICRCVLTLDQVLAHKENALTGALHRLSHVLHHEKEQCPTVSVPVNTDV